MLLEPFKGKGEGSIKLSILIHNTAVSAVSMADQLRPMKTALPITNLHQVTVFIGYSLIVHHNWFCFSFCNDYLLSEFCNWTGKMKMSLLGLVTA